MDTQPSQFAFKPEHLAKLHALSAKSGKPESEVLDELLDEALASTTPPASPPPYRSALEAFMAAGVIGCIDGPGDLTTNPKHMEGFGKNG